MTKTPREIINTKTDPEQTICDEAERLWAIYLKTQNGQDLFNYEAHVLSHDEDFEKLKEYREGLEE